jgi:hypothetical protein
MFLLHVLNLFHPIFQSQLPLKENPMPSRVFPPKKSKNGLIQCHESHGFPIIFPIQKSPEVQHGPQPRALLLPPGHQMFTPHVGIDFFAVYSWLQMGTASK